MSEPAAPDRLVSLDAFRGLTIAGMVLVNNPGTWAHIYDPLEHAAWHGITPTDYIFPFFLFIVGAAIPFALGKLVRTGSGSDRVPFKDIYWKIISRSLIIFALGLAISVVPFFQFQASTAPDWAKMLIWLAMTAALLFLLLRKFLVAGILAALAFAGLVGLTLAGYTFVPYIFDTMRIPGVLQRIAVCYLVTALIFLHTNWKQQLAIAIALLLGYWLLMTQIAVPGCDVTTIDDKACNLAAYLDRLILGENHIWRAGKVFDPEGILSTLPAIATTISGVLTGTWLRRNSPPSLGGVAGLPGRGASSEKFLAADLSDSVLTTTPSAPTKGVGTATPPKQGGEFLVADRLHTVSGLFFFGIILVALGWIWNIYFPFNKSLWTSSYVVFTSGLALCTLGACYWLIDVKGYKKWALPFVVFGVNALALFVFSGIMARMLGAYRVAGADEKPISVQKWIFDNVYSPIAQPVDASLLYAISFILVWLFLMWLLYRKQIFIKV